MVGLIHPSDLQAWQRWQQRRRGVRGLLGKIREAWHPAMARSFQLTLGGERPRTLIAIESLSPSQRAALLAPIRHLPAEDVAILSTEPLTQLLPEHPWQTTTTTDLSSTAALGSIETVLAAGHYLPVGAAAYDLATRNGLGVGVVQHGLLVPMAPPLPQNAHLLAWTAADGAFWSSRRSDVTAEAVGSQLFWEARVPGAAELSRDRMITWATRRPVYLGQLHGAEVGRWRMARAATRTLRHTDAVYRPHPNEKDILSRLIHQLWLRRDVTIDRSPVPLPQVQAAVIGVFSTGILEAAARGIPAWVDFDRPPAWLEEFWQRYGMSRLGEPPTAPPTEPDKEPALAVAQWLLHNAER